MLARDGSQEVPEHAESFEYVGLLIHFDLITHYDLHISNSSVGTKLKISSHFSGINVCCHALHAAGLRVTNWKSGGTGKESHENHHIYFSVVVRNMMLNLDWGSTSLINRRPHFVNRGLMGTATCSIRFRVRARIRVQDSILKTQNDHVIHRRRRVLRNMVYEWFCTFQGLLQCSLQSSDPHNERRPAPLSGCGAPQFTVVTCSRMDARRP